MNGPGEPQGSQLHGWRSRDEMVRRRLGQTALPDIDIIAGADVLLKDRIPKWWSPTGMPRVYRLHVAVLRLGRVPSSWVPSLG